MENNDPFVKLKSKRLENHPLNSKDLFPRAAGNNDVGKDGRLANAKFNLDLDYCIRHKYISPKRIKDCPAREGTPTYVNQHKILNVFLSNLWHLREIFIKNERDEFI